MRNLYARRKNSFRIFSSLIAILLLQSANQVSAQTTVQIGTGTDITPSTLYSPVYRFSATSTTTGSRSDILFLASEMAAAGIPAGATITAVAFNKTSADNFIIPAQHQMLMGNTTNTTLPTTTTWASILASHTQVYTNNAFNVPNVAGWVTWNITPFVYTGNSLEIATETTMAGNGGSTGPFPWEYTNATPVDRIVGVASPTGATLNGTVTTYKHRPNIRITYTTGGGGCTNPPVPGTVSSSANPVCMNIPFTLSVTGGTSGVGQTYQWQISPNNTSWTNIPSATSSTLTTSQTSSNYYRLVVTCGVAVNSASIQVITPAAVAGTYTINSALPTGGTNFQSFTAAYNFLSCGISGPVIFNVDPLSGPYTEQLIINYVPGSSATNTITFNGNGRVLQFTSTNTNERAVIKLNGANWFIFDSLTINATATTTSEYGFGVQLLNDADSNIVRKCQINITSGQTSTNHVGISISGSATSATTTGSDSDDNLFDQNTITGGYYGITNLGTTTVANQRNKFTRNIIRDFYLYGIYNSGTFQTLIEGNDLSRPTRTVLSTGTSQAIYFTSLHTSALVNANRIHDMLGGDPTLANDIYGIYFTGVDALAGLENKVTNNAIYDIRSNGIIYAIYNAGSDNIHYYHNTISLDDAASTATDVARGFYQTTLATGIEFKDNIITLGRGGTGNQHALYFNTATSVIVSNYNDFFFNTAANRFVGYNGTNQATLINWQTATSQDLNSVFINPLYQNAAIGNLKPTSAALNNLGTPVGVTTDIIGAPRSLATPDMGAWEFDVGGCVAPPIPGTSTASPAGPFCPNELVNLGLTGNSIGTGQSYQWQTATSLAGPWTNLGPVLTSPGYNINPTTTLYYRAAVTCAATTTFSTPIQVVVNASFPAGTYTINSAVATGGTNFQSFNDAYYALRCGISGPVIFNVVVGSGPYTEQLIMGPVQGTSVTNTVTWNGNGETIRFTSTNTNERAVIKLNGTDYFIFDSLTVQPTGTTTTEYGFGFHLINGADSNIIRRSKVLINKTSTSTNYAGIVSSALHTSATGTGTNESDGNIFDRNTIEGGYYSITSVGSTTAANANNKITNNIIRDQYLYGIYLSGNFNTLVEANDIARPTRTDVSTFYGVYMTSLNTSVKVSKNRIHNPFDGELTATSVFGGVYITGVDALAGLENVVSNNAIYNVNGLGTHYGLYNSSSDNAQYYHNTINMDQPSSGATESYGFYQTGLATGIDLKDNIFYIGRGGTGDKYGLYFVTATSVITSNYNAFFKNTTNAYVGYNGTNQSTLLDWQTATGLDANSIYANPSFTSPSTGNLEPRSTALDNRGTPIAGITTDIRNASRSLTTPDMGAWEFTIPPCTSPPTPGTATATPNTLLCVGTPISLGINGNSVGSGQTYQWQFSTTAAGPYTNLGNVLNFPDTIITAAGALWYRAMITCGASSVPSAPVQVTMVPPFPPGTYTINNTIPTSYPSGTNFNTFVEAVAVMNCGIGGPVIFNVAPGTYNEQVRIHSILGTSAVNRVTFQSANGIPASVNLTYGSTLAAQNYTLQLDSASYITFKNMTITATNATNGRAVDFVNTASYDSLLNNIITVPASTLTTTTIVGVFGSLLSGTDLVIKGNVITGGMSGIHMTGQSTTIVPINTTIDSNNVSSNYYYGIYASNAQQTKITRNTVQVTSPRNTTGYGIYLTNNDSAYQVNANRVTITGMATTTYGIYLTGCAASNYTGSVSRNIVIGNTGNTGSLYGIYQTTVQGNYSVNNVVNINTTGTTAYGMYSTGGSGGMKFYNNTVQNASPATGTTNIAGYFSHTTSTLGPVDIRNNIYSHTGNGIAIYQGNVANIYLDYNMYYTAGPTLIRQGTVNYATLQAWRNAENWDYASIVYPPAFTAAPELMPDAANADSWAMHGRGVQITDNASDINGNPRPTTLTTGVPDLGAYEFLPTVLPPVLPATPAVPAPGVTQRFMFGTDTVQKITWAPASTVPATVSVRRYSGIIPPGLTAGQQSMYFYVDDDITGSAPTNFTKQQFYIDSWMRNIPSEPTVKLGRTNAAGAWVVASGSVVDFFNNVITESNLSFIDKFTGMTDGQAALPPPPPPNLTDTSNRGRRFWVGYGHHYSFNTNGQDMVLYLSAEDSANVTVKVNGTGWTRTYAIPANTVRVSDLMPESGLVDSRLTDEGKYNRGISIESDVPIVAYAHIYEGAMSGASLLLPTGTYGYEYRSLNSAQYYPAGGAGSHSWFYVVADRDSTLVEITPSAATKGGRAANVPFTVYLMRGEVYNVMGVQNGANGLDLTGSTIRSIPNASGKCYPIAVFSGSSRTALCNTTNGDNFIQQVFPNQAWGTKYLTFATANSASNNTYYSNKWRIMVKNPATVVRRNGVVIPAAQLVVPGNYYEFGITGGSGVSTASYIEADQPVMVAQYMLSSDGTGCPGLAAPAGDGDPEMIYISPLEQGIKKAVFYNTNQSAINSNYINVIIPTPGLASLRIDGASTFTDVFAIPNLPGYSGVRHNLGGTAAQHTIISDSAFNAITYGLGSVESYGYNAGTLVKNLSALPVFNNVFNTGTVSSYTCRNTPFRLSVRISDKPTQLVWNLSGLSNLSPNANVTQVNPLPSDSITVNGKKFYIFTLPLQYTFNTTGSFTIPINISHPSIEGCSGSQEISLTVNVIPAPVANFTTAFTGCVGDVATFNGTLTTSNGVLPNTWTWNFGDATPNGTGQTVTHTYAAAGSYNVNLRAIALDGCIGDTTKPVVVNPRPVVAITQDTVYVCNNASAVFTVQGPVAGVTYNWYNAATGGNLLGTGTTFTLTNVTGITNVYLAGVQSGCASVVRDRATAAILPTLQTPVITVDSIGTNILVFRWTAVTGTTGYQVSTNGGATWSTPSSGPLGLTHTVTGLALGTTVSLQVRALGGCLPAVSLPVSATTRTDQVYIPNSFTPNNDGLNDNFRVYSNVVREMHMSIFNQWGQKIFETFTVGSAWDGTHINKPQPSGVYIYVINMVLNTGERIQRKGAVNLVR